MNETGYDTDCSTGTEQTPEDIALEKCEQLLAERNFSAAFAGFSAIIAECEDGRAYWGRAKARVGAATDTEAPRLLVDRQSKDVLEDIRNAIECSEDDFADAVTDIVISASVIRMLPWERRSPVFGCIANFLDEKRADDMLGMLYEEACSYASACTNRDLVNAENIVALSQRLFNSKNKKRRFALLSAYAGELLRRGQFRLARKYFEELAAEDDPAIYLSLLACTVRASNLAAATFDPDTSADDGRTATELLELAIVANAPPRVKNDGVAATIRSMIIFQADGNAAAQRLIDGAVECYERVGERKEAAEILFGAAESLVRSKKFDLAQKYYEKLIAAEPNGSRGHWGLLRCAFKAHEEDILYKKRTKALSSPQYMTAIRLATPKEIEYYSSVMNNKK